MKLLERKDEKKSAEMEVGSGFSGRVRVGPGSGRVSGLTFQREIGLNRGHTS